MIIFGIKISVTMMSKKKKKKIFYFIFLFFILFFLFLIVFFFFYPTKSSTIWLAYPSENEVALNRFVLLYVRENRYRCPENSKVCKPRSFTASGAIKKKIIIKKKKKKKYMNFPFDNTKDLLCICLIVQHYNQTLFFFFYFPK